jgi:H/ACA ribonucleoprotein complex subunit 3
MKRIRYCQKCNRYTLKTVCDVCGGETIINAPLKYSSDESVAFYRRELKKALLDKK